MYYVYLHTQITVRDTGTLSAPEVTAAGTKGLGQTPPDGQLLINYIRLYLVHSEAQLFRSQTLLT
jgi:hypothetical protein